MKNEIIRTRMSQIWLDEDGIIRATTILPHAEQTLADAHEIIVAVAKISQGKKYPLLSDVRNIKSVDRPAREYFAKEFDKVVSAAAGLVGSPMTMIMANFFLRVNKPSLPTRLFTSEAEAIEWLKGFIE